MDLRPDLPLCFAAWLYFRVARARLTYSGIKTAVIAAAVSEPEANERGSSLIGKKLH